MATVASRPRDDVDEERDARRRRTRQWLRQSKLSYVCFAIFAVFLLAQSLTGWRANNADQAEHHEPTISYPHYLRTGHFFEATFENWESEFLQMGGFILLSIWLVQQGSEESKPPEGGETDEDPRAHRDDPDAPGPVRHGGLGLVLYENSLLIAFFAMFFLSITLHAWSGAREFSSEELAHGGHAVGMWQYVTTSQFWFESFQNWQSEFLAVGTLVVLTIFLRQRGSAQSKPVHAPHSQTGEAG